MIGEIEKHSDALIGNKIYFFETKEEKKLSSERDIIIDKLIEIQNKKSFDINNIEVVGKKDYFFRATGEWLSLSVDLEKIETKLKKTCSYLSPEDSIKWEQGRPISDDQIIKPKRRENE
tara:strand:+ start:141 stop:497 length:357 start_codon:yes stop_codon:yes gene_type:complete